MAKLADIFRNAGGTHATKYLDMFDRAARACPPGYAHFMDFLGRIPDEPTLQARLGEIRPHLDAVCVQDNHPAATTHVDRVFKALENTRSFDR